MNRAPLSERVLRAVNRALRRAVQGSEKETLVNDVVRGRAKKPPFVDPNGEGDERTFIPAPGDSYEPPDPGNRPPAWAPYHHPHKQKRSESPYNIDRREAPTYGVLDVDREV